MTDGPNIADEDIPTGPSSGLPVDAAGNPAGPFDPEKFAAEQQKRNATNIWNKMADQDALARRLPAAETLEVTVNTPEGQKHGSYKPPDLAGTADTMREEAGRLRRVAKALIDFHDVNELDLLATRIANLQRQLNNDREQLVIHQSFRDEPAKWGYVMLDGSTPIDHEQQVALCKRMEATDADIAAELGWYAAVADANKTTEPEAPADAEVDVPAPDPAAS